MRFRSTKDYTAPFGKCMLSPWTALSAWNVATGKYGSCGTLERLRNYIGERERYTREVEPYLDDCAMAVDIGVPLLAHAAAKKSIPSVTFFDHSWACTLRGVCSPMAEYNDVPLPTQDDRSRAEQLASEIERDESVASEVFVFDRYITPPEFREHWQRLGYQPKVLPGVLGTRQEPAVARQRFNRMLNELRQEAVADGRELVLISPGGTAVWNEILPRLIDEYTSTSERHYLPVLAHPALGAAYQNRVTYSRGMRWFPFVPGATLQAILPAFDLVVTRAGGGIVNDCLASRVPLVCVEEHQWQVQLIERECKALGLIPDFPETSLSKFRNDPVGCIDTFVDAWKTPPPLAPRTGVEKDLAVSLLSML